MQHGMKNIQQLTLDAISEGDDNANQDGQKPSQIFTK